MKDRNSFKKNKKGYRPSYEKYEEKETKYNESKMKPYYINEKKRLNENIIAEEGCNSDYFEYKEIISSISNICTSLMTTGIKVWIKHIPTISYMKSKLLEISDRDRGFINPIYIPDYLINNLTFKGMSEDFVVLHPNEVKNKSQDFIDVIYTEMKRNGYLSNDSEKSVISLLAKVKTLMEDGLRYSKLAEFANKYYYCEFANNSTITIVDIRNRMLNSLADTAFAIEAERIKPVISESYIKVYIRAFIMEHASAYQELLNLSKPKRSTVISEESKK